MRLTILTFITAHVFLMGGNRLMAQEALARWSFDQLEHSSTLEEVSKQADRIVGYFDPAVGIGSGAIQLDGYTSYLERAEFGRDLPGQFTGGSGGLKGTLRADPEHPAMRPAFVLNGARLEHPVVRVDGAPLAPGRDFQHGTVHELDQWKTVIWLDRDLVHEAKLEIAP
jgi:hypothetical protein